MKENNGRNNNNTALKRLMDLPGCATRSKFFLSFKWLPTISPFFLPFFHLRFFTLPPIWMTNTWWQSKYTQNAQQNLHYTMKCVWNWKGIRGRRFQNKRLKNRPMQHQSTELICNWLFSIFCNISCLLDFHNLCFRTAHVASSRPPAGLHKLWERFWNLYNRHRDPMGITICECSVPCSFMN